MYTTRKAKNFIAKVKCGEKVQSYHFQTRFYEFDMVRMKKSGRTNALIKVKRLCKASGFSARMLEDSLAKGSVKE